MERPLSTKIAVLMVAACFGLSACGSLIGGAPAGPATVAARTSSVSFVVDKTTTYGTLEVPAHHRGQRLAAALLIPGSGPTDRNGNQVQNGLTPDTLQLVAAVLAREGIMTLRFDKYFSGRTGAGAYSTDPAAATVPAFSRQATAAYDFLSRQPAADPKKMLVAGHSEGGMFALLLAGSLRDKPVGLALLEPQDQRVLDLVEVQTDEAIGNAVAQGQLAAAQAPGQVQVVQRAIAQFRAGQPVSTQGMAPIVLTYLAPEIMNPSNAAFVRSNDAIYPPDLALKVKGGTSVLVTDGTRDPNVPPSTIGPLVQALTEAGAAGPGFQLLQNTDHFMHLPSQPKNDPVLAPAAVVALRGWAQPFASTG